MAPCKFFAQGRCTYGVSCRNSHEAVAEVEARKQLLTLPGLQYTTAFPEKPKNLPANIPTQVKPPCWFFSQGKCTYGASCRRLHEMPSAMESATNVLDTMPANFVYQPVKSESFVTVNGAFLANEPIIPNPKEFVPGTWQFPSGGNGASHRELKAEAPSFTPSTIIPRRSSVATNTEIPACIFFSNGLCRNGVTCAFRHDSSVSLHPDNPSDKEDQKILDLSKNTAQLSVATSLSNDINGASVTFEAGAEVSIVKLSSDFSTVQISGLSPEAQASFVTGLLAGLGFQVLESNVLVKSLGEEGSVAEVKVEDPTFAKVVICRFDAQQKKTSQSKISIKPMTVNATNGALGNRLQLSTVTCTWYKPSRVAWLVYKYRADAMKAKIVLEGRTIRQRTPTCSLQLGGRSNNTTLQVGNLDVCTQKRDLNAILTTSGTPTRITLGDPSYPLSDAKSSENIEVLLRRVGGLESFQWQVLPGNSKIKATATFIDHNEAIEAVRSLNNTTLRCLGNTKLFVGRVISVKYNVPNAIMDAINSDIDQLRENIWQSGHVHLKSYPQTEPAKPITAVRVFGENTKHVAEAKAAIEKMLAGTIVMDGDSPLWDPYFLNAMSLSYLNELSRNHKIYIHRDARKSHLLIYGGSSNSRSGIEKLLAAKIKTLRQFTQTIVLTPDLLKRAMQGGMRRLKARFGNAVTLNLSVHPKTISIAGSEADVQEAQTLLLEDSRPVQPTEDCVVCWTEATEALNTSCGHVYCKDCFANQASSAGDGDIPLRCYGSEGKCLQVFGIYELKKLLNHTAFEELLEASFDTYIRTHPKDFQHCPTPDCPQVYRITATGEKFHCSNCLAPVCTTCNVVAHDGMTCEEYKDLSSEGTKAFQKWKKEHDVRDCPNCKTAIEKSYGCNHMECKQCSTHICWSCMKNFQTSGECYAHMRNVHQNIYAG